MAHPPPATGASHRGCCCGFRPAAAPPARPPACVCQTHCNGAATTAALHVVRADPRHLLCACVRGCLSRLQGYQSKSSWRGTPLAPVLTLLFLDCLIVVHSSL
jgi:hypothetical protein